VTHFEILAQASQARLGEISRDAIIGSAQASRSGGGCWAWATCHLA